MATDDELRMKLADLGSPEALADCIIDHFPDINGAVPLERIADALGILEITKCDTGSFEAVLVTNNAKSTGAISVNANSHRERQRYSVAHELGHYKHKHIVKRLVISFVTALVFFAILGWLAQQSWFYIDLGIMPRMDGRNDAIALILFFIIVPVFTFVLTPLMSWFSRRDEFEADRFAVSQSAPEQLVSALVKLVDDNAATLTPDPIHSAFYDSHPPAAIRIRHLLAQ